MGSDAFKSDMRGNGSCDHWKGKMPLALGLLILVSEREPRRMLSPLKKNEKRWFSGLVWSFSGTMWGVIKTRFFVFSSQAKM